MATVNTTNGTLTSLLHTDHFLSFWHCAWQEKCIFLNFTSQDVHFSHHFFIPLFIPFCLFLCQIHENDLKWLEMTQKNH
jgi:hypothetical protein